MKTAMGQKRVMVQESDADRMAVSDCLAGPLPRMPSVSIRTKLETRMAPSSSTALCLTQLPALLMMCDSFDEFVGWSRPWAHSSCFLVEIGPVLTDPCAVSLLVLSRQLSFIDGPH